MQKRPTRNRETLINSLDMQIWQKREEDAKQLLRDENKSSDWNTQLQLFKQEMNYKWWKWLKKQLQKDILCLCVYMHAVLFPAIGLRATRAALQSFFFHGAAAFRVPVSTGLMAWMPQAIQLDSSVVLESSFEVLLLLNFQNKRSCSSAFTGHLQCFKIKV